MTVREAVPVLAASVRTRALASRSRRVALLAGLLFAAGPAMAADVPPGVVLNKDLLRNGDLSVLEDGHPVGTRDVYYERWGRTVVYRRDDLGAGAVVRGPAVVEEYGSTLPVHPGFTATMDDYGNLVVVSDDR